MIFPAGTVNPFDYVSLSKSVLVLREDQIEMALEEIAKKRGPDPHTYGRQYSERFISCGAAGIQGKSFHTQKT